MSYTVNGIVENTHTGMICGYFGNYNLVSMTPQIYDPPGWIIANGIARPDSTIYDKLFNMGIGTRPTGYYTPPNLNAAFLRGSGSQTLTISSTEFTYTGPDIKTFADSKFRSHTHTASQGAHNHKIQAYSSSTTTEDLSFPKYGAWTQSGQDTLTGLDSTAGELDMAYLYSLVVDNAQPTITVPNTAVDASSNTYESRPYNIGTSWIIKL